MILVNSAYMQNKNEVFKCLKQFLNKAKTEDHKVKTILSDGGKKFDCEAVRRIISDYGKGKSKVG